MPRILMVIRPGGGGAFGHVAKLGSILSERGHEVAICGPHADREVPGVEMLELEIGRSVSTGGDLRAVREQARIYREWKPDVIHAHGSKGGIVARFARFSRPRTPLIHTPHGYAFDLQVVGGAQKAVYWALEQAAAPLATRVLAVCEHEGDLARRMGLGRRVRVVHNGIAAPAAGEPNPEILALRERGPVICVVSELHPRKGTLTFVDSLPSVLAAFPSATVIWAGEGPDRAAAEARVAELGIGDSIRMPGLIDGVEGLLLASDLYVSPSWAESFPYSVLEAMGAARPIVATDVGGVGEAIEDGVTGRLVPARSSEALAEAMIDLLGDPDRGRALGASARERVLTRFSLEKMIEGTMAVYGEVAA